MPTPDPPSHCHSPLPGPRCSLRGYAQRDPLVEYKLEGYNLFVEMMAQIRRNVIYNGAGARQPVRSQGEEPPPHRHPTPLFLAPASGRGRLVPQPPPRAGWCNMMALRASAQARCCGPSF